MGDQDYSGPITSGHSKLVLRRPYPRGSSPSDSFGDHRHHDGRLDLRLGGGMGRPPGVRHLETVPGRPSYQRPGDEGGFPLPLCLDSEAPGQGLPAILRQLDSSSLLEEGGGVKIATANARDGEDPTPPGQLPNSPATSTPSGLKERDGRSPISETDSKRHRMAPRGSDLKQTVLCLRPTPRRHVRDKIQQSDSGLCFALPGRQGLGGRRPIDGLVQLGLSICVPSASTGSSHIDKDTRVERDLSHTSRIRSPLTNFPTRPRADEHTAQNSTREAAGTLPVSTRASPASLSQQPGHAVSDRLATIRGILSRQGFSDPTTELLLKDIRQSSSTVYNSQWSAFARWCHLEKIDPLGIPVARLADYLTNLFNKGLQPATIKVHRAAINSVLRLSRTFTLEEEETLRKLVRAITLQRPRSFQALPPWSLGLVLRQLLLPPFVRNGTDGKIPLRLLTLKTVFLVAMASAARADELAALSREGHNLTLDHLPSGGTVCNIRPFAGFFAKNATPEEVPRATSLPGIAHLFKDSELDRLLCPVRAVLLYLKRTDSLPGRECPGRLFGHFKPGIKFRKSHISLWLAETIRLAYEHSDSDSQSLEKIKGHQVRGMAASWAYFKYVPLSEVRKAVGWKTESVFARHYLRDVAEEASLHPSTLTFVAAGHTLTH